MLDIDTAIKHCLEVAEQNETQAEKIGRQFIGSAMDKRATDCRECAADRRQLAEWLTELKELRSLKTDYVFFKAEAKKLLRAAVEGYSFIRHITKNYACPAAISCSACPMDEGRQCRIWEHADEALALIGEDGGAE